MIYLRNRYYDPEIGRFISEDPIRDGLNWYVYCSGNPVAFVDPWGLAGGPRFVVGDNVRFRSVPGTNSSVNSLLSKGTAVDYTGNKTGNIDGHIWAEVLHSGITGWVAADYLGIAPPGTLSATQPSEPAVALTFDYIYDQNDSSVSNMMYGNDNIGANGCEIIAVYNALVHIGDPRGLETIISDAESTDGILWLGGKFGSHPDKLGLLFDKYERTYTSSKDRANFNSMLYDGGTYIVSYWNSNVLQGIHTVMFTYDSSGNIFTYNSGYNKGSKAYSSLDDFLNIQGNSIILYEVK